VADDFARFDLTHTCPGCGATLTRKVHWDTTLKQGTTAVDLLHPQPVCAEFAEFVQRLLERQSDERHSSRG
jgi:hypothetical protein